MYIGYFDEFGHIGPYVSRRHARHNTHPVYGVGGFVLPADSVQAFSKFFASMKKVTFEFEINRAKAHHARWEKKGAALLTTQNMQRYREARRAVNRVISTIEKLGGFVCFYGQEKPRGDEAQVHETSRDRHDHCMKQLILRLDRSLTGDDRMLMILDAVDSSERLDAFVSAASFIYTDQAGRRLIEPPMQVESHLYPTVQAADWMCALISRISAYKYDPDCLEFEWAVRYFGNRLSNITSTSSKVRGLNGDESSIFPRSLTSHKKCYDPTGVAASADSLKVLAEKYGPSS